MALSESRDESGPGNECRGLAQEVGKALSGTVAGFQRLTAGASMETYAFELDSRPLILRRAPGGNSTSEGLGGISLMLEAEIIRAARDHGVSAPDILHVFAPDTPVIGSAYVMARLPGEALPHRLFKDQALGPVLAALPARLAREMAAIHSVPADALPDGIPHMGARELVDSYRAAYHALGERRPVYDLTFRWLEDHLPAPFDPPVLVHADFRMGNLLVDETGLTAVLDWEIAHLGDPHQDLAYICAPSWRFGRREKPVGGIGDLGPFLAAYEDASGRRVDRERFAFWEVLTTLFWGTACMIMLADWREGRERTLERAAIGRRISEVEIDLLLLLQRIEGVHADPLPPIDIPDTRAPSGQTSLREMMTALAEWNRGHVMPAAQKRGGGRELFQSRIAANLLQQLDREAQMGRDFALRGRKRLGALDLAPQALSDGLADGSLDWRAAPLFDHLRLSAMERMLIDQPRYHGLDAARSAWCAN